MRSLFRLLPCLLFLSPLAVVGAASPVAKLRAVPTYESIGLYWKPDRGAADKVCRVRFRTADGGAWREGLPLVYDANEHAGLPERSREYRGSLVLLQPDTLYEVEVALAGTEIAQMTRVRTWSDQRKVKKVVTLPELTDATLRIDEGGSAEEGYVVYEPAPGRAAVLDAKRRLETNVQVNASFVVLRGLTLLNARQHAIRLGAVTDVVIERCDISGWGENLDDGWGRNFDSAIFHETKDGVERVLRRITIQQNELHHPASDANSWLEERTLTKQGKHPIGPQAITFMNARGELVIRHNRIHSDLDHMFNDTMGEYRNFSYNGFPAADSDIYGNWLSHCWDDGIEAEGGNMNVRIWGNVIDTTFDGIGGAVTSLGPCYIFRNIYVRSRKGPTDNPEGWKGQCFLKLGGEPRSAAYARGAIFVFHNTLLQPPGWGGDGETGGASRGLQLTSPTKVQLNLRAMNNVLFLRRPGNDVFFDAQPNSTNRLDYNLYIGKLTSVVGGHETHGIEQPPVFDGPTDSERPWLLALKPGTPGADAAARLPNFNDDFAGKGPDMGAIEAGRPLPGFFPAKAPYRVSVNASER